MPTRDEKKSLPKGKYELGLGFNDGHGRDVRDQKPQPSPAKPELGGRTHRAEDRDETITYTGCKLDSEACSSSGQAAGTVKTGALQFLLR